MYLLSVTDYMYLLSVTDLAVTLVFQECSFTDYILYVPDRHNYSGCE